MAFLDPSIAPFVSTFLFVFAVVFGLLSYAKVGDFGKRVNAVIALAFALFAVLYEPLVFGLQQVLPFAIIILIFLFFILFVKKLFSPEKGKAADTFPIVVALGILLAVFAVLGENLALILPSGVDVTTALWVVGIIIVLLFFYAAYKHESKP